MREYRDTHKVRLNIFIKKRALRIYPLHFSLTLFIVLLNGTLYAELRENDPRMVELLNVNAGKHGTRWQQVVGEFLYLQPWLGKIQPQTWSLAIEEHFYALVALVMHYIARHQKPIQRVPLVFGGLSPFIFAFAVVYGSQSGSSWPVFHSYNNVAAGVIIAYFQATSPATFSAFVKRHRWLSMTVGVALVPLFFQGADRLGGEIPRNFIIPISSLVASIAFTLSAIGFPSLPPVLAPVEAIGRSCYAIYLLHWQFVNLFVYCYVHSEPSGARNSLLCFAYVLSALAVGHGIQVSYDRLIKRTYLKIGRESHKIAPINA